MEHDGTALTPGAAPGPGPAPGLVAGAAAGLAGPSASASRLARVEVFDPDGRLLLVHDVTAWPLRIGRALDNELVINDPHVAPHHAELVPRPHAAPGAGLLVLHVGRTVNGVQVEATDPAPARTLRAGEQADLPPQARWHVGRHVLRVQLADEALAPELALAPPAPAAWPGWVPLLATAVLVWQLASSWLARGEDDKLVDLLGPLAGVGLALFGWCVAWGLGSKLFSGRFVLLVHLRIALLALLASAVLDLALPALAFALDAPWASRLRVPATLVLAATVVAAHLGVVLPRHRRRLHAAVAAVAVLTWVIQTTTLWQRSDRLSTELYADVLMPPAVRLVPAQPVAAFSERLRALEAPLRARAQRAQEEEFEP